MNATDLNRLYWETDKTVSELIDELRVSRNALYGAIEPLPAGAPCPDCGRETFFSNRSDRSASRANCSECGRVIAVSAAEAGTRAGSGSASPRLPRALVEVSRDPDRAFGLAAGLLLGVVAGGAGAWLARKLG
ncbi:MAG: hypothetical protein ACREKN_09315 [Longimicrobiaceae bacterium]